MKFYLDEDLSPAVAEILRRLGCSARSAQEAGNREKGDEEQLDYAAQGSWVFVTRNRDDFVALNRQFFAENRPHAGIVVVPRSVPARDPSLLAKLLLRLAADHPEGLPAYAIVFLRSP